MGRGGQGGGVTAPGGNPRAGPVAVGVTSAGNAYVNGADLNG
jgi:hypothetical protein